MIQNTFFIMEQVLIFLVQFNKSQGGYKAWELDHLIDFLYLECICTVEAHTINDPGHISPWNFSGFLFQSHTNHIWFDPMSTGNLSLDQVTDKNPKNTSHCQLIYIQQFPFKKFPNLSAVPVLSVCSHSLKNRIWKSLFISMTVINPKRTQSN